jgi:DNA-binding winged helix-turn-helix (wHTH) protein
MHRSSGNSRPAQARRGEPPTPAPCVRAHFSAFELDELNARLLRGGEPIALPPTPFAVLCALVRRAGALVTKTELLDAVWGHRFVTEAVLKTAVSELRTALVDDARRPRYIETVSRRGYRFIGGAAAPAQAGAPAAPPAAHANSFVGRVNALERLTAAWSHCCAGNRTVAWVAGDAGIGKSTLIDHFVSSLDGVATARGQCIEQRGEGEPFFPVLEALAQLSRTDSSVLPLLRSVSPGLLLQFPWLTTAEDRDALRQHCATAPPSYALRDLGEFFDRYTERRPLLLVTEDLHWGDSATVQLIEYLARRRGTGRLLWIASFRFSEIVTGDHPLQALRRELRLHDLCEEIVLDPFSETEVADYVRCRAPWLAGDETFVRELHERTDGMPLLLRHVVNDAIERARLASGPPDASSFAIPAELARIVAMRTRFAPTRLPMRRARPEPGGAAAVVRSTEAGSSAYA